MRLKRKEPSYSLERCAAGPIEVLAWRLLITIIVVLGGWWIIPLAHRTLESVGKASAEPTTLCVCVREPWEASLLGGGLREERLQNLL